MNFTKEDIITTDKYLQAFPKNYYKTDEISFYKDVIFSNGKLYTESKFKPVSLHNRINIPFETLEFTNINFQNENIQNLNNGIILLDSFHSNMGHLLWDFMYPSWYGLFYHQETNSNNDFQWMTTKDIDLQNGGWHLDVLEKFSGNPITTFNLFVDDQSISIRKNTNNLTGFI
jgi:hypothetical protein